MPPKQRKRKENYIIKSLKYFKYKIFYLYSLLNFWKEKGKWAFKSFLYLSIFYTQIFIQIQIYIMKVFYIHFHIYSLINLMLKFIQITIIFYFLQNPNVYFTIFLIHISRDTVVSRAKFTQRETDRVFLRETKNWDKPRLSDLNNGWADWVDNKFNPLTPE